MPRLCLIDGESVLGMPRATLNNGHSSAGRLTSALCPHKWTFGVAWMIARCDDLISSCLFGPIPFYCLAVLSFRCSMKRKMDSKDRACLTILHQGTSIMCGQDHSNNRQSHAHAVLFCGEKRIENTVVIINRDASTGV